MTAFGVAMDQLMQDCGEGKGPSARKFGRAILIFGLLITLLLARHSIFYSGFAETQSDRGRPG